MNRARVQPGQRSNALIFLFLLLVVPLAFFLNIWSDEASTLYSTQNGIADALTHAAANEKQAPLYFWVLSVWRMASGSIFFARLFSVICAAAAIRLFASLASRLFEPRPAFIATAFFAFHPFLIWTALEIRVYALVVLLTVALLSLFFRSFWDEDASLKQQAAFLVTAIAALYTNYYLAFLLGGFLVALVVTRRWRSVLRYSALAALTGLAFLPWIFVMRSQLADNTSGYIAPRSVFDGMQRLWRHFLTFVLPAGVFPEGEGSLALISRVWIVRIVSVAAVIFGFRYRERLTDRTLALAAMTASVFVGLFAAYFLLGPVYIEIRHMSVAFVPLLLMVASLLTDLFQRPASQYTVLIPALVVLLFFAYSVSTLYPGMSKRGDWARVGAFIQENETDGQPIIVFTTFDALALPYHYHGRNKILPDEGFFTFDQEAEFGTEGSLKKQTDFVISEIPGNADSIWLAVNEKCITTDACIPLQNFIAQNYTIEKEKDFYLEKVFLLRKKR